MANVLPISRKVYWAVVGGTCLLISPIATKMRFLPYNSDKPRPEKTIIVTGATGRLGHATAKKLAIKQCRVIMACRDMDRCKAIRREIVLLTKNNSVVCRHLDLEDIDSINKFVDEVIEKEPHIDVLINNAAVRELDKRELTKYGIEKHFFVNFLAPFLLTLRLMPKLEESAKVTLDSRVINVIGSPKKSWHIDLTDINFEKRKYKNKEAYQQSKLALAYFSILLEKFNRQNKNSVYVFGTSPGTNRILPMPNNETALWEEIRRDFSNLIYKQSPEDVCNKNIRLALDNYLVKENQSGRNFNFVLYSWGWNHGWGIAAENEDKAKLTWNMAADFLLNVNPNPEGKIDNQPTSDFQPPGKNMVSSNAVQVNAQGNNKASGVLESA